MSEMKCSRLFFLLHRMAITAVCVSKESVEMSHLFPKFMLTCELEKRLTLL